MRHFSHFIATGFIALTVSLSLTAFANAQGVNKNVWAQIYSQLQTTDSQVENHIGQLPTELAELSLNSSIPTANGDNNPPEIFDSQKSLIK